MPTILTGLTRRTIRSLAPGAMFWLPQGVTLAISVGHNDQSLEEKHLMIFLSCKDASMPDAPVLISLPVDSDEIVADYGPDWVLEVNGPAISNGNGSLPPIGSIGVSREGAILYLNKRGQTSHYLPGRFKLDTLQHPSSSMEADEVIFGAWRIWLNEADRNRPGARPIFEWPVPT